MSPMKPHHLLLLLLPLQALATCTCSTNPDSRDTTKALYLKLIAIASILTAGALGILIPILGRSISFLQPEHTGFFIIKAFAAGVILATGLIHILPEAFERLTSPCLGNPHHRFPFAGFIAMVSALATMMIDASATSYYKRSQMNKPRPVEEEEDGQRAGEAAAPPPEHAGGHVHGSHGHSYGSPQDESIRNRVISQVLELGIVVHSVIIGFSLGSSMRPSTIRTLVGALSFHQLFEGIGLGGCIVQMEDNSCIFEDGPLSNEREDESDTLDLNVNRGTKDIYLFHKDIGDIGSMCNWRRDLKKWLEMKTSFGSTSRHDPWGEQSQEGSKFPKSCYIVSSLFSALIGLLMCFRKE